jgi:hypothetical protein
MFSIFNFVRKLMTDRPTPNVLTAEALIPLISEALLMMLNGKASKTGPIRVSRQVALASIFKSLVKGTADPKLVALLAANWGSIETALVTGKFQNISASFFEKSSVLADAKDVLDLQDAFENPRGPHIVNEGKKEEARGPHIVNEGKKEEARGPHIVNESGVDNVRGPHIVNESGVDNVRGPHIVNE